ncbi:MAG: hypothetical protein Kow0062_12870 [Acidobacteriota bacterium]
MAGAKRSAWDIATAALARRALTRAELVRRLRRREVPQAEIDATLARLERLGFVDDRRVAYNHAAHRAEQGRRGRLRVRRELLARGIPEPLVDEVLAETFPPEDERDRLERLFAQLTAGRGVPEDERERARLARRLLRAGFPGAMVRARLEQADAEPGAPQETDDDEFA